MNKNIFQKIEDTFAAAAFAEAGEDVAAMNIAGIKPAVKSRKHNFVQFFEKYFAAIGFAEAGCFNMARQFTGPLPKQIRSRETMETFLEIVGLDKAHVCYGMVTIQDKLGVFLKTVGLDNARVCYGLAQI